MKPKISVVINSLNEERNLVQAIESVKWADEILVCDMHSDDDSVKAAKKLGARVILHQRESFVEPARNFALGKASHPWILLLDPDEEISTPLKTALLDIASEDKADVVLIPRKNLIFNKWVKASMWWPDYNVRFFKKGMVTWQDKIHSQPKTTGRQSILEPSEDLAIIHHHYDTVSQFITRLNRYTSAQAADLIEGGYHFQWPDLIKQPLSEFLGRFFANQGYRDGLHGLVLCLLQAFSHLVVYIKVWELEKFIDQPISLGQLEKETKKSSQELKYWFHHSQLSANPFKQTFQKIKHKLS